MTPIGPDIAQMRDEREKAYARFTELTELLRNLDPRTTLDDWIRLDSMASRSLPTRLRAARTLLREDRRSLFDCSKSRKPGPTYGKVDSEMAAVLAKFDDAIAAITEAIKLRGLLTKEQRGDAINAVRAAMAAAASAEVKLDSLASPAVSHEPCRNDHIDTLVHALMASKGWMRGYAEAFVDEALSSGQLASASQPERVRDWCTYPSNCSRCKTATWDQVNKHHAGVPMGAQNTPAPHLAHWVQIRSDVISALDAEGLEIVSDQHGARLRRRKPDEGAALRAHGDK